jgi:TPR repeat protein
MSRLRHAIPIVAVAVLTLTASWFSALVSGQSMTACDREVGHPSDPDRVGPGVSSAQVDTEHAIAACRADLLADPDNPRLQYQLARAIVYHADRHGTSYEEGMVYLAQSANSGHVQAMFVYGLMLSREARVCEAAPWTRRAADGGLKAARLAYVDSAVGGQWADCDVTFDKDVMSGFLNAAADQVSGYYEKMLLGALRREVAALAPVPP